MTTLDSRLDRLERRAAARATCRCVRVITDGPEPELCPHGRPWSWTIRITHDGPDAPWGRPGPP